MGNKKNKVKSGDGQSKSTKGSLKQSKSKENNYQVKSLEGSPNQSEDPEELDIPKSKNKKKMLKQGKKQRTKKNNRTPEAQLPTNNNNDDIASGNNQKLTSSSNIKLNTCTDICKKSKNNKTNSKGQVNNNHDPGTAKALSEMKSNLIKGGGGDTKIVKPKNKAKKH